jgi:hypothetical protein
MMRHGLGRSILACLALAALAGVGSIYGEVLEYEITALNPLTWVIAAKEVATGEILQFRLPPTVFKGHTFDADLEGVSPGQKFRVRGPKNAVIENAIVEKPTNRAGGQGRGQVVRKKPAAPPRLGWEIIEVNAAELTITARNRSNRTIVFKVEPKSFIGYRFTADLAGVEKGGAFTIVSPNLSPLSESCVLIR